MSAKQFRYYDNWKAELLTCPLCGWQGTFEEGAVEHHSELMDSSCPHCVTESGSMLAIVSFPTMEETAANWDKLSERERQEYKRRRAFLAEWESRSLKSPNQLPELPTGSLHLVWDFEEKNDASTTVIRHGESEIWREPALYEGYQRFAKILEILRAKYGDRLIELEPTPRSNNYLYGDSLSAIDYVENVRAELRKAE